MIKQRCYCVVEHSQPLQLQEGSAPEPKGTEVLVRVSGAGVCHSDLHIWEGRYDIGEGKSINMQDRGMKLPLTMGHEIAGTIVAAGPDAPAAPIGSSVVVYPWLGCGQCSRCLHGEENLCLTPRSLGVFLAGGYADYVLVPHPRYCVDIAGLDPAEAAPLACSGVTTYSAIRKFGDMVQREPVVIFGAGGLGNMALQVLKAMDAKGAVFVDIDPAKREAALAAGALAAIDGAAPDAAAQIAAASGGPRMVLDLVGAESTLKLALASATRGTDIVVVGLFGGQITVPIPYFPLRPLAIRGSYVGTLADLQALVALAKAGKLPAVPVTRRPLTDANDALMQLRAGKVFGRVVLVP